MPAFNCGLSGVYFCSNQSSSGGNTRPNSKLPKQPFFAKMQEATNTLRRAQRKVDWAKKRTNTIGVDGVAQVISDDDMDEQEPKDEEELPRDENAQRIQEGLNQVVTSLVDLSHNAEKLEPKPKRPRTKEEEDIAGPRASQPSMQPFAKADAP